MLSNTELNSLIQLRKEIHRTPELAHKEKQTAKKIIEFLDSKSDHIIKNIGGNGIAFVFDSGNPGATILFRSELDALPIFETNDFEYASVNGKVSHKCGHDGHMTVLAGLGLILSKEKLNSGKVILLYQPAEETGEGAELILRDEKFSKLKPDYIFALHNLPGFPLGKIIIKNEHFAAASKGMIIKLEGKTSHAAEPEKGISPVKGMIQIIDKLQSLVSISDLKDFGLITVIHARLGERAFGTSPGAAEIMCTLRSFRNDDMEILTNAAVETAKKMAARESLTINIEFTEDFPATINNTACIKIVQNACEKLNLQYELMENPFKWSEDFGHFTEQIKGALFGIGAGENTPALHNPNYDFPDELIETGSRLFYHIVKEITESNV